MSSDVLLSARQAAEKLGVGLRRVQQFVLTGVLPATPVGGRWVIREADLVAFIEVRRARGLGPERRAV